MRAIILPALAFAAFAGLAAPASASGVMTCKSGPQSGWQAQDVLKKKLAKAGWQVRKVEIDGNCYEVYGTTPEGDRVEAYFHPVSLEKLYVARRGQVLFRKPGA